MSVTIEGTEAWMRIMSALHHGGCKALCGVWSDKNLTGLLTDVTELEASQRQLFMELDSVKDSKGRRVAEKFVMKSMVPIVFPISAKTNIFKFDVTLHTALLLNMTIIKPTVNLPPFDLDDPTCMTNPQQIGDFILYLKQMRNSIVHLEPQQITHAVFLRYWSLVESILKGINGYDVTRISPLKMQPFKGEGIFSTAYISAQIDLQQSSLHHLGSKILQTLDGSTPSLMSQHISSLLSTAYSIHTAVSEATDVARSCEGKLNTVRTDVGQLLLDVDEIKEQNKEAHAKLDDINENVAIEGKRLKRKIDCVDSNVAEEARKVRMGVIQEGIYTGMQVKRETVEYFQESAKEINDGITGISGKLEELKDSMCDRINAEQGKLRTPRKTKKSNEGLFKFFLPLEILF